MTPLTLQQVFDNGVRGVIEQGALSVDDNGECRYRMGASRCAIGWSIPDVMYEPSLEGLKVYSDDGDTIAASIGLGHLDAAALRRFQECHDAPDIKTVEDFRAAARQFAVAEGLDAFACAS